MSQPSRANYKSASSMDRLRKFRVSRRGTLTIHQFKTGARSSQDAGGTKRTVNKSEVPISIENEQRGVIVTATQVSTAIKSFKSTFKQDIGNLSALQNKAEEIVTSLSINDSHLDSVDKFVCVLKERKIDPSIQKKPEFEQLETFCDKVFHFNQTMTQNIEKLSLSIDKHLTKFLLSFIGESNKQEIKCVMEYENKIKEYTSILKTKRKTVKELMGELNDSFVPFGECFLAAAEGMNQKMDAVSSACLEICHIMKLWSANDRIYPAKLWDEIISSNIIRGRMLEDMKRAQRRRDEMAHGVSRRQMALEKLVAKLEENKRERKKSNAHKDVVFEKINRLEEEMAKKRQEQHDTEMKFKHRKSNSPRYLEMLENQIESLKIDISKLKENIEAMKKQAGRYGKAETSLTDVVTSLEKDIQSHDAVLNTFKQRLSTSDADLHLATMELKEREAKIAATKRIRDIKLTPTTLRNIYYQQLDPTVKDNFMDACTIVSKHIGNSWRVLYKELPFVPIRDVEKKQQDVHHIYVSSLRRDQTIQEQALESLKKWRVFNRRGNVNQLIYSLKRIEKLTLARKIENHAKTVEPIAVA